MSSSVDSHPPERQRDVVPAETDGRAEGVVDSLLTAMSHHIQIDCRILLFEVQGGRQFGVLDGQHGQDCFERTDSTR